jgi:hypothetical protein
MRGVCYEGEKEKKSRSMGGQRLERPEKKGRKEKALVLALAYLTVLEVEPLRDAFEPHESSA